jgi:glycerol-3-phosphate dehydrogenase
VPALLRTEQRRLTPFRRAELDRFGVASRTDPQLSGMVQALFDRMLPGSEAPTGEQQSLAVLLERYGSRARRIAEDAAREGDRPLDHAPDYSTAEIAWLCRHEHVRRLEDLLLRRTNLALLGRLSRPLLVELAGIWGSVLGRTDAEQAAAVAESIHHIRQRFGIDIDGGHRP